MANLEVQSFKSINEIDPDNQYIITVRGHGFRLENPS